MASRYHDALKALILKATAQGFDVEIRVRKRLDGKEGELKLPSSWVRREPTSDIVRCQCGLTVTTCVWPDCCTTKPEFKQR